MILIVEEGVLDLPLQVKWLHTTMLSNILHTRQTVKLVLLKLTSFAKVPSNFAETSFG
jgi:hypothetical protein